MFNRFVATLLMISLTACSSVPRSVPPGPSARSQTDAAMEIQPDGNLAETSNADARPEFAVPGPAKVIAVVLLVVLVVVGLAGVSRAVSRDFARSCCKVQ